MYGFRKLRCAFMCMPGLTSIKYDWAPSLAITSPGPNQRESKLDPEFSGLGYQILDPSIKNSPNLRFLFSLFANFACMSFNLSATALSISAIRFMNSLEFSQSLGGSYGRPAIGLGRPNTISYGVRPVSPRALCNMNRTRGNASTQFNFSCVFSPYVRRMVIGLRLRMTHP